MRLLAAVAVAVAVAAAVEAGLCLGKDDWWDAEQDADDEIARVDGELAAATPALPVAALQTAILCRLGTGPEAQRSSRRVGRTRRGVVDMAIGRNDVELVRPKAGCAGCSVFSKMKHAVETGVESEQGKPVGWRRDILLILLLELPLSPVPLYTKGACWLQLSVDELFLFACKVEYYTISFFPLPRCLS